MSIEELIQAGKDKVRNDAHLMAAYIEAFFSKFGHKPNCAPCTFNYDWQKLVNSTHKNNIMSEKTFRLKNNSIIYSYDEYDKKLKRNVRKRMYGNVMTEDFAEAYLTNGTEQQVADRKKQFAVLPGKMQNAEKEVTVKELKQRAKEAGHPEDEWKSLKKDELIAYLASKEIDSENAG